MRLTAFLGTLVLALAVGIGVAIPSSAASPPPIEDPVKARLVAETGSIAPGETVWVALHLEMRPGWHVYWRNPGDAGLPPEIAWKLPPGFTAGEIAWPTPERFVVGGIGNYGYAGAVDLLVPITAPAEPKTSGPMPGGSAPIAAHATLARLLRYLHSGRGGSGARPAGRGRAFRPRSGERGAVCRRARAPAAAGRVRDAACRIRDRPRRCASPPRRSPVSRTRPSSFFPTEPNIIDAAAEPRTRMSSDGLDLLLTRATGPTAVATLPPERRRRADAARRRRNRAELRDQRPGGRRCRRWRTGRGGGRHRERAGVRLVAGAAAGVFRRRDPQPDAVRLPDPVAEAAGDRGLGASRRGAPPRPRLCRRRDPKLRRARRALAGVARRRRRDRLGLPAAIARRRRAARLSAVRDGSQPVRGRRIRRGSGRDRRPLRRADRTCRRLRDRDLGDDRRDPVHGAVHGHGARLCNARGAGRGAGRFRRARRRARRAGRAGDGNSRHRAPAAAARPVDAVVQAAAGVSALCDGRLAGLGAAAADRAGRRFPGAARPGAGRVRGVDLRPHAIRRAGRAAFRPRPRRDRVRRLARRRGDADAGGRARRVRFATHRRPRLREFRRGPARPPRLRENAGFRQSDRGLVHHLSRQRAHARQRRDPARLRRARDRRAKGRLDAAGPGNHRPAYRNSAAAACRSICSTIAPARRRCCRKS